MRPNVTGIVLALALGIPACSSRAGDTLTASTREEALSPATTPPSSSLVAALTALRYLNDVDVYVTGDIVAACSDTQGRMAAGGSITLQRYEADSLGLADLAWGGPAAAATSVDCGGTFDLVNGSIAGGARGVECGTVDASHYDLGNVRATCAGAHEPKGTRSDGSVNGVETCGPLFFPEATFAAQMDAASTAISELFAGVTPAKPKVQAATGGGTELVFAPTSTAAQSFYIVSAADLLEHWVLTPGSVYFITTDTTVGPSVTFEPASGVAGAGVYAILYLPGATTLHIGRSAATQVHHALTILAPSAAVDACWDVLDGGLYAASLFANPDHLPATASAVCGPGAWVPGAPPGTTSTSAGLQINHVPFTNGYPASMFGGNPLP